MNDIDVTYTFDRGEVNGMTLIRAHFALDSTVARTELDFILPVEDAQQMLDALRQVINPLTVARDIPHDGSTG